MKHFFVLLLLATGKLVCAEILHYDMFLWGEKIGTLTISKTTNEEGAESYVLDSHIKAKILWVTRENTAHMETVFKGGKLVSSFQKEVEDGKTKRWTRVTFDGTKYLVDGYRGKKTFTEIPTFAVAPIYFYGLKGVTKLFYEAEAEFCNVSKIDENTWEFKSSDGTRNVYHIVNGKAASMEFHASIATVKVIRVE